MRRIQLASLTLALIASACSAPPPRKGEWTHSGGSAAAADLERAKADCTDQAVASTADMRQQGLASKAALGVFTECMRKRGWTLQESSAP
jgi:hypothetical protein